MRAGRGGDWVRLLGGGCAVEKVMLFEVLAGLKVKRMDGIGTNDGVVEGNGQGLVPGEF